MHHPIRQGRWQRDSFPVDTAESKGRSLTCPTCAFQGRATYPERSLQRLLSAESRAAMQRVVSRSAVAVYTPQRHDEHLEACARRLAIVGLAVGGVQPFVSTAAVAQ